MTLNLLRWLLAGLILLPVAGWVLRPGSELWRHLGRYSVLGLLGVGCYNALQYLALKTSTPLNVTLTLPPPQYARKGGEIVAAQLAKVGIGEITRHLWLLMAATFAVVLLVVCE